MLLRLLYRSNKAWFWSYGCFGCLCQEDQATKSSLALNPWFLSHLDGQEIRQERADRCNDRKFTSNVEGRTGSDANEVSFLVNLWQVSPFNGDGNPNIEPSEAVLQAQEDLSDWEILNPRWILNEKHNKMGNRQVKVRIWCEGEYESRSLYWVCLHLQPVSFWFAENTEEKSLISMISVF